jgi:phage gp36-like protein
MSAYCTQADILGEIQMADLIDLTDDAPFTGNVNTVVLNQVIANASGLIDQYIANVYQLPLAGWPPAITSMAVTITCYRLYRRRQTPDEVNKFFAAYKDLVEFLKKVQAHESILDLNLPQAFSGAAFVGKRGVYARWGMGSSTL